MALRLPGGDILQSKIEAMPQEFYEQPPAKCISKQKNLYPLHQKEKGRSHFMPKFFVDFFVVFLGSFQV